jgi:hypothetical protein
VQKIQDVLLLLVTQISPLDSAKITRRQEKKKTCQERGSEGEEEEEAPK